MAILPKEIYKYTPVRLTSDDLERLVKDSQKNNTAATELLCRAYKPLVYQEAGREYIYSILREDAVNIAWEIFLTFIRNYRGRDYKRLPGLIKSHLHYELLHITQKELERSSHLEPEPAEAALPSPKNEISSAELRLLLDNAMCGLTSKQRQIIRSVCIEGRSLREESSRLGCSPQNSHKHLSRGIAKLRRALIPD